MPRRRKLNELLKAGQPGPGALGRARPKVNPVTGGTRGPDPLRSFNPVRDTLPKSGAVIRDVRPRRKEPMRSFQPFQNNRNEGAMPGPPRKPRRRRAL